LCSSQSTFFDNAHRRHTGLAHYLEKRSIKEIHLMHLALHYCVKYSALDARHLGLNTHVMVDGCRGIELEPGTIDRALDNETRRLGATAKRRCRRRSIIAQHIAGQQPTFCSLVKRFGADGTRQTLYVRLGH
jgi:nicotinamidase-related amidase